jgi:hypothetical protein
METVPVDDGVREVAAPKRKLPPHVQALVKTIGGATVVLYAMGWAVLFAQQDGWAANVRATYGYQFGWVACLASCAVALVLRRGQEPVAAQPPQPEMTCVSDRPRTARRRRFVMVGKTQ